MSVREAGSQSLASIVAILGLAVFVLTAPIPSAHASTGPYTEYNTVIEYSTSSGYTPTNVDIVWNNTDSCGTFNFYGAGATWSYGAGVGTTPCKSSLPGGTISITISANGTVLASCTDTHGAATYGSNTVSDDVPECTSAGTGVTINLFFAQAYHTTGNNDWIIALVVIVIVILFLLFFYIRRREKTTAPSAAAQAASVSPGVPPASAGRFCRSCGSPVGPDVLFCPSCGKVL